MSKTNFVKVAAVALLFMLIILEVQGRKAIYRKCHKCPPTHCGKTPGCNLGPDMCLPILDQYCPLNLTINLCAATLHLLDSILSELTIEDVCIDIYWDTLNCCAPPTNIFISLKKCILTMILKNVTSVVNCISLTLCKMLLKKLLDGLTKS